MIRLNALRQFKVSQQTLRSFLILIILGLLLLKVGYQGYQKKLSEKKKLYQDLRQALLQKRLLLEKNQPLLPSSKDGGLSDSSRVDTHFLDELFPKMEDPILLQVEISKALIELAEKKGLKPQGLEFLNPVPGKRLSTIPIIVRAEGPIKNTLEYLEEAQAFLRKKKRFFRIDELSLYTTGYAEKDLRLTLKVSFFKSEL